MIEQRPRIAIKALCFRGRAIEWNYDHPNQCSRFWQKLIETGRAPDTGDLLESAIYFDRDVAKKTWEKAASA